MFDQIKKLFKADNSISIVELPELIRQTMLNDNKTIEEDKSKLELIIDELQTRCKEGERRKEKECGSLGKELEV